MSAQLAALQKGGPMGQARNLAVFTGVNAGLSLAIKKARGGKDDVWGRCGRLVGVLGGAGCRGEGAGVQVCTGRAGPLQTAGGGRQQARVRGVQIFEGRAPPRPAREQRLHARRSQRAHVRMPPPPACLDSMGAAFGAGVCFSLVSGVPNPLQSAFTTGAAFAGFNGLFYQISGMFKPEHEDSEYNQVGGLCRGGARGGEATGVHRIHTVHVCVWGGCGGGRGLGVRGVPPAGGCPAARVPLRTRPALASAR